VGARVHGIDIMTVARARQLRHISSPPERELWRILHGLRQRGYHFRRQHPIGPFYADFACVKAGLVIEADGITHTSDTDIARDRGRAAVIERHGFRILRFWNNDIMGNPEGVFAEIERALEAVPGLTPTPVPSPSKGGGRPRTRKVRTGLKDLAARTGTAGGSPTPVRGGDRGGVPPAPGRAGEI
jgi:very-short-patch-repair endonuclease